MADVPIGVTRPPLGDPDRHRVPWPVVKGTLRVMALLFLIYFFVLPIIPGFRNAARHLRDISPAWLALGMGLELSALLAYSVLTHEAIPRGRISLIRLFRIQLSTKSISSIMPAGSAPGNALGYRLMTLSGVDGPDAGFALATVGLGSAVVLNLIFLVALAISIPLRGVINKWYGMAAVAGIILVCVAALIVFGLLRGEARAERLVKALARRLKFAPDRAVEVIQHVASRVRELFADRRLLARVVAWAIANWLLDAAALWVFTRSLGGRLPIDGLLVAFCLANLLAVVPILPGGLFIIEGVLIPSLVGFGLAYDTAWLGVFIYRIAQYWFPILLGGLSYLSLRVGPWSIERRDSLKGLRQVAGEATRDDTSGIEWAKEYGRRGEPPTVAGEPLLPAAETQRG